MGKERRRAIRTVCSVSLYYRLLANIEFSEAFDAFSTKRTRMVIYDQLKHENHKLNFKLQTSENELAPILLNLNHQLSLFTDLLSMDMDALYKQTAPDVVISTTGMTLYLKEKAARGDILEIQLCLTATSPRILLITEIISCSPIADDNGYHCAVSFTFIDKEDKQRLKQFSEEKNLQRKQDLT